jgi:hypothetical protein
MGWWKRTPEPEESALIYAAMRLRMEINNLNSTSPNKIDRAWAAVIADSLEQSGYSLVKVDRPQFANNAAQVGSWWKPHDPR